MSGSVLIFDVDKLAKLGRSYDLTVHVQLKFSEQNSQTDSSDNSDGSSKTSTMCVKSNDIKIANNLGNQINISQENLNYTVNNTEEKNESSSITSLELSEPSYPSASNPVSNFTKDQVTRRTIYRIGRSDNFACNNCKVKGDKFYMEGHACKISKILDLIKCKYTFQTDSNNNRYSVILASPATGVLHVTEKSPYFIQDKVSMRGKSGGRYPYHYLEMIDYIFGREENTIHVCSGSIQGRNATSLPSSPFTVDINPSLNPDYVGDAQKLNGIANGIYARWLCDPPYNRRNAEKMYGTELPNPAITARNSKNKWIECYSVVSCYRSIQFNFPNSCVIVSFIYCLCD